MPEKQSHLFGFKLDALDMDQAVGRILLWTVEKSAGCRFVVTPNVDHAVLFQEHPALRAAYADADLILADGHPIVWASRLLGQPVPARVPGSDLVPCLFQAIEAQESLRVFLLGAAPGVAQRAAANIQARWPNLELVGTYSPPPGFEQDAYESAHILGRIALTRPHVVVVGLGAPKQECWVHQHRHEIQADVALCVGATIDFLAGEKQRAPVWMQRTGIEWLHRMCSEPRRLIRRYARDAWIFPQLVMQQWVSNRTGKRPFDHRPETPASVTGPLGSTPAGTNPPVPGDLSARKR